MRLLSHHTAGWKKNSGLGDDLDEVDGDVEAFDVTELVRDHGFELFGREPVSARMGSSTMGRKKPMTAGTLTRWHSQ